MFDDSFIKDLADNVAKDENGFSILNLRRVKELEYTYNVLKSIVKGNRVQLAYEMNAPYTSMGYISIIGKGINITEPELFTKAAQLASNVEMYPKVDGTVQINFTFHGLTRKVGD